VRASLATAGQGGDAAKLDEGCQTPIFPVRPDGSKKRRRRSFFAGYLTRHDDLVLLSITVIVDMISAVTARRCFRSLTDAYIRPAPDRR